MPEPDGGPWAFGAALRLAGPVLVESHVVDGLPVLVVDGVFEEPGALLRLANSLDYDVYGELRQFRNYPGRRAQISYCPTDLMEFAIRLYREHERGTSLSRGPFARHPVTFTKIRGGCLGLLHPKQKVPHLDVDSAISGIVHLSGDGESYGGTNFYRHRETGLGYLPPCPTKRIAALMEGFGYSPFRAADYLEFRKRLMYTELHEADEWPGCSLDRSSDGWELCLDVPGKFNRMILFPSNLFHSPRFEPGPGGGDGGRSCRTTLNLVYTPT